jgi:hypothetical protein
MNEFESLLASMSQSITNTIGDVEKLTPTAFERRIYEYLVYQIGRSQVEYSEGSTSFPDVVVLLGTQKYGIEVKLSRSKSWRTIGNSIMEGTAKPVDMTYVFMGKIDGNKLDIRYRRYEDCIDNIVVTHSPRYHLDINLQDSENIFTKMNSSYESFRALDERGKISEVKAYYRSKNDTDYWWIDSDESDTAAPVQISFVSDLDREQIDSLRIQLLARFPHMVLERTSLLFPKTKKYKDAAIWLLKQGYLHTNIRDMFSANSEQKLMRFKAYPTVYTVLYQSIPQIKPVVDQLTLTEVKEICYLYLQQGNTFQYVHPWRIWQQYVFWMLTTVDNVNEQVARDVVGYR